ncbi:MAG: methionyl-tRNA formyltransferase [Planctomycetes bacterium]|nr:methionyl-tRNA formyltransferase [Planctomycetota bacterium]
MKLVFAGTPDFAVPSLERLAGEHRIAAAVTRPDRPAGRGRRVRPAPVAEAAGRLGIPVLLPENVNESAFIHEIEALALDAIGVVSFGKILSKELLAVPRLGCFNLHASILPEYRGASPVQAALAEGREETGVTVIRMTARMDAGPVLSARKVAILPCETAGALLNRLARTGAEEFALALAAVEQGRAVETAQDDSRATYCRPIAKANGEVDWSLPAARIVCHWQAMTPWPGAFTWFLAEGRAPLRVTLEAVEACSGPGFAAGALPGRALRAGDGGIDVAAGDGAVRILALRPEGKRAMSAAEFVRGRPLETGARFGKPDA